MEQFQSISGKHHRKVQCFGIKMESGMLMQVEKSRLGLEEESMVDIINVKCEPDMVGLLTQTYGFLSGYHMNKKYWITMLLDGRVSEAKILDFLDLSYDLIDQKKADGRNDHR